MRRRKSVEPRFFVGIAAVAVLCILSAGYSGVTGNPSPVSRAAGAVIRPVQRLASGIVLPEMVSKSEPGSCSPMMPTTPARI